MLHKAKKENPDSIVVADGCYVQTSSEEAARDLSVDIIIGNDKKHELVELIENCMNQKKNANEETEGVDDWKENICDINEKGRAYEALSISRTEENTRAFLKVQDGCNNFCSYCIIPYARGPVRSLPLETAAAQARGLAGEGYREIVVTGIEVASWGWDFKDGSRLPQLIAALCEAVPEVRVRLGSLEPRVIDAEFCRLAAYPNLCPQFHLSMQSGCDTVLKRMRRKYDTARYLQSVEDLKRAFPGCAVTTDMIVGFPGETEEEFLQSLEFIRRCGFAHMHIFPYSRREGTPAAAMPEQVPKAVKEERARRAAAVAKELREAFDTAMLGTVQGVLFEQIEDGLFTGHAPNGVKVYAAGEDLHNRLLRVRIEGLREDGVFGALAP